MEQSEKKAIIRELTDTVHDLLRNTGEDDLKGLPQGSQRPDAHLSGHAESVACSGGMA